MSQTHRDLTVRPATPADIDPLLYLISSAYRGDESRKGWTTEADLLTGDRIDAAGLLTKIVDPDGVMLLAAAAATTPDSNPNSNPNPSVPPSTLNSTSTTPTPSTPLLACCELRKHPTTTTTTTTGTFGLFAVSPYHQRTGLGTQILHLAEHYARATMGLSRLELHVIFTRAELIAWYTRRGYQRTGERRPFPYELLVRGAKALRDDLYFEVLGKDLGGGRDGEGGGGS